MKGRFSLPAGRFLRVAALLLLLLPTGCGKPVATRSPAEPVAPADISDVMGRFEARQKRLEDQLRYWRVFGVLDVETEEESRRNRMQLSGQRMQTLRMRVFGPMSQPAIELWMGRGRLRLVNLDQREVYDLPATAQGLNHLTGIHLDPNRLVDLITGHVGAVAIHPTDLNRVPTVSEVLSIDPQTARLISRRGSVNGRVRYQARYQWPQQAEMHPDGVDQPEETDSGGEVQETPPEPASPPEIPGMKLPPGFQLALPLPAKKKVVKKRVKKRSEPKPVMPSQVVLTWSDKAGADLSGTPKVGFSNPARWKGTPPGFKNARPLGG